MTTFYIDVSSYTKVPLAGQSLAFARATIDCETDSAWSWFCQNALTNGVPLYAYHFINSQSVDGNTPEAQADYAYAVAGVVPAMLDLEPNRGACATIAEGCKWIDHFRASGGVVNLLYYPRWVWQQQGSPDLKAFRDRGMSLVSSNYTTYSDSGPGWAAYGGINPTVWQYTSSYPVGSILCDRNAFKGTVSQLRALIEGKGITMNWTDTLASPPDGPFWGGRNNSAGQILVDLGSMRDWGYTDVTNASAVAGMKNPPPANSPLDLQTRAARQILAGITVTMSDTDRQAIANAVASSMSTQLATVEAQIDALTSALAALTAKLTAAGHALDS